MNAPYYADDKVTLWHGDCLEVLATMDDASVDAVVTDPPYGLEFMGKAWDSFGRDTGNGYQESPRWGGDRTDNPDADPRARSAAPNYYTAGAPFQRWCTEWAAECLRVLKPGGHLLAFGGSRTWHRLACAVEDAGFEVRDEVACLLWAYGCLSDDTEILTADGWRRGLDVGAGDLVAQWDHTSGAVSLAPVEQVYRAPWRGPLRVLRSADTDQLLTPNHRVYHRPRRRVMTDGHRRAWYDPEWQVAEAGELSTWNCLRLPIAGVHDGPGIGGEDYAALLGWVWTEGGFDPSGTGVRVYHSRLNADKVAEPDALFGRPGPHRRYDRSREYGDRTYVESMWFLSGELARRIRADLPDKRPTYGLLWRMTADEKRALLRAAMLGDGSGWGGSAPQFYQKHEGDLVWLQALLSLVGMAGKVTMRPDRPGGQVSLRHGDTTELQSRHLRTAWEDYDGEVWCVRVPSGAFVARRKGRVFITGNSGFPKSLDVGKAIDKAAGAEREVVGPPIRHGGGTNGVYAQDEWTVANQATMGAQTAPATPEAARWEGWGTALKPAWEPVVVARKPLAGTVAANVLEHGTGALNIDRCRVATTDTLTGSGTPPLRYGGANARPFHQDAEPRGVNQHDAGRWPANLVLTHHPDCPPDRCVPGCHVAELDAQSGTLTSGANPTRRGSDKFRDTYNDFTGQTDCTPARGANSGGASRFYPVFRYTAKAPTAERPREGQTAHPTVKPLDLMRWLVRLVTPPGGTVLDPFAGSGTTGEACQAEGFRCVLIEREPDYLPLIVQRLTKRTDPAAHLESKGADLGLLALLDEEAS